MKTLLLKSSILVLSAFFILGLSECKKDDAKTSLTLQFNTTYNGAPYSLGDIVTDASNRRISIEKLKFYISHVTLIKNDNSELEISAVELLNALSPESMALHFDNVEGDFKAIKFGIGVDSLQNGTDPLTVSSASPLSNNQGMYWGWLKYQFVTMEGRGYSAGNTGLSDINLLYHIGSNPLYRTTTLTKSISLCCEQELTLNLNLDINKIFIGDTETIDVSSEGTSQTDDYPLVAEKFVNNFSQAITLD